MRTKFHIFKIKISSNRNPNKSIVLTATVFLRMFLENYKPFANVIVFLSAFYQYLIVMYHTFCLEVSILAGLTNEQIVYLAVHCS